VDYLGLGGEGVVDVSSKDRGRLLMDSVAVVTGAGRGIGRAVALLFAAHGATVYAVARTESDLVSCATKAARECGTIIPAPGDVTDPSFVAGLFQRADREVGRLDILVTSAGIAPFASVFDMNPSDFRACLELNVWAVFMCMQQALRMMRRAGRGKIINVGSVRSHWSENGDAGAYNASKQGMRALTESVARELHGSGLNIAVGLICPGAVDTSLTNPRGEPRPDWLRAEEVAEAILHAASAPSRVNVFDTVLFSTSQSPW
jgi:NAD(P)-dependent dehydrogenase (short-subunit alcohol dehydrogenase family)